MAGNTVVLNFYESLLHHSDLELLRGPHWVNDNIISFYFEYLEKVVFRRASDLLFVSPEVTQCIKMSPRSEIKIFLEPLNISKKKFVFFALNDNENPNVAGGTHWSLLIYSKPDQCFMHYDSLKGSNHETAWQFSNHLKPYLSRTGSIDFMSKDCLQQGNGYDCGIHVMCNAEGLAHLALTHGSLVHCSMQHGIRPDQKRKELLNLIDHLSRTH